MKIIKKGNTDKNWWLKKDIRCKLCGCIFQLEEDDARHGEGYVSEMKVNCPSCKHLLLMKDPNLTYQDNRPLFEKIFGDGGTFEVVFGKIK